MSVGGDILKSVVIGTSDAAAVDHPCYFWGAVTDVVGAVILYNSGSAANEKIVQFGGVGGSQSVFPARPRWCSIGIYADVTSNSVTVFYTDG